MKWYLGNIANAIQEVQKNNICLFVFVTDNGDKSEDYEKGLENNEEVNVFVDKMICLKIKNESEEFKQFSDFYAVSEVPSIHIISPAGTRLKCLTGDFNNSNILEELKACTGSIDVVGDARVPVPDGLSVNERQAMLQAKMEEKRKKRAEEEKEKEIIREKERRELGKEMNKFKVIKKEQDEKDVKEEIRKRRQEEKEARENVLRRIEEDKRERKMRRIDQASKHDQSQNIEKSDQDVLQRQNFTSLDGYCRIQFRFPDGNSTNSRFQKDINFCEVRQFVKNYIGEKYGNARMKFELKQFFPRRAFDEADDNMSLESLNLVPSASLAVVFPLPSNNKPLSINSVTPWFIWPINLILGIINSIFSWLQSTWAGTSASVGQGANPNTSSQTNQNPASDNNTASAWEARQKRLLAADSRTIKQDGKMATFTDATRKSGGNKNNDDDDDDDDDARWNGNSTQQM